MNSLRLTWKLFAPRDKLHLGLLLGLMIIGGLLETCGIGLVFPYIALIGNPRLIESNRYAAWLYSFFNVSSPDKFIALVSVVLLGVFVAKNSYYLFLQNLVVKFASAKQAQLGQAQLRGCVLRPYSYFLRTNSAAIVRSLTFDIPNVANGVIVGWLNIATEACMMIGTLVLVVYVQPIAALMASLPLAIVSAVFFRTCREAILQYGNTQTAQYAAMVQNANEILAGIKEIKISGRGDFFVGRYLRSVRGFLGALRKYQFVVALPKAFLEVIMVGGMILVILALVFVSRSDLQKAVPLLGLYAAVAIRVMPAVNRAILALNNIRVYTPALEAVEREWRVFGELSAKSIDEGLSPEPQISFTSAVKLTGIVFKYDQAPNNLFDGLSMEISYGQSVGLIGGSGSGKSTVIDLLLGLLAPQSGSVTVDGWDIRTNPRLWQSQIGYVPQHIYLADDTIARNIALGVADDELDHVRLDEVIELADLGELLRELPEGSDTMIGERGVLFSGGQRQKIGIARALYHDPTILVFDEATSALDNLAERRIIAGIRSLARPRTIIMVAHRLSSVRECDVLYLFDCGRIVDTGGFEALAQRHPAFMNSSPEGLRPLNESPR